MITMKKLMELDVKPVVHSYADRMRCDWALIGLTEPEADKIIALAKKGLELELQEKRVKEKHEIR